MNLLNIHICPKGKMLKKFILLLGVIHLLIFVTFILYPTDNNTTVAPQECSFPQLPLWTDEINKYFFHVAKPNCLTNPDWVRVKNLTFIIDERAVKTHGKIICDYKEFWRLTDLTVESKMYRNYQNGTKIGGDFFSVNCSAADSAKFEKVFAVVKPVELPPQISSANGLDLNVVFVVFDSVSRLAFMRKMPRTYEYLTKTLRSTVLEGYNIVGDGTIYALMPILTGHYLAELPSSRIVDRFPFVWKEFTKLGWATLFGEDSYYSGTGVFKTKGKEFAQQPTTHYLSTYHIGANTAAQNCQGEQNTFEVHFDYIKRFFEAYPNRRKFAYVQSDLSHHSVNIVGMTDGYIEEFLTEFRLKGWLNDTLLVVMSDHGNRYKHFRATQQGKLEEKNPFVSILLPDKADKNHPEIRRNLQINAKRLTTPFDLHPTIRSTLNYKKIDGENLSTQRGISLFSEVPKFRTCRQAAIEPHWCVCFALEKLSTDNNILSTRLAQLLVTKINNFTSVQRSFCTELTVKSIKSAFWHTETLPPSSLFKQIQQFFKAKLPVGPVFYQISIVTEPGESVYEATVSHNVTADQFSLSMEDISIITEYKNISLCAKDRFPHLMKFCFCKPV